MAAKSISRIGLQSRRVTGVRSLHVVWAVVFVLVVSLVTFLLSMNRGEGIDTVATNEATKHQAQHSASSERPISAAGSNPEGSKHATVMAMASGYSLGTYKSFVGSLLKSGFKGKIILGVSIPMNPGVEEYLRENNVIFKPLKFVNCAFDPEGKQQKAAKGHDKEQATCAHPYADIKLRWSRFPLLRDWLKECVECTGPVLISDFRDVFFQRDPFGMDAPEVKGLQVFEEHRTQTTEHWITQGPIKTCKGVDFGKEPYNKPMLCSGTTVGTRDAMLNYLSDMHAEMMEWMKDPNCCCNKMNGDDQSIHNYLFYTGKLPYATAIPNRMGIVNTVGVQASMILEGHAKFLTEQGLTRQQAMGKPYLGANGKHQWIGLEFDLTDKEGYLIDFDGSRSRVVHQWDRFGLPFNNYRAKHQGNLHELLDG